MSKPFQFKQFHVSDSTSAMKVGTDAVLLGAFAEVGKAQSILDIGTGCGIIALMIAQRSEAKIDAIDIDKSSIEEAKRNFKNSPWSVRLTATHSSMQDYAKIIDQNYNLIVSNPPFFENSLESPDKNRNLSKHSRALSHQELLAGVAKLLSPNGFFEVILPLSEREKFINLALVENFYCQKELIIFPKKGKVVNRIILRFSDERQEIEKSELIIRNADNLYTEEYISLTKDFYLHL